MMFELRIYVGARLALKESFVNPMIPLNKIAAQTSREGGFNFTRAECWQNRNGNDERQWEFIVD